MQNNPRPPKPIWGSEITLPTDDELINETVHDFLVEDFQEERLISVISACSKDFTPTEAYLEMTKRLIESDSLSPRTSTILEDLYERYRSISGYGPTLSDLNVRRHHAEDSSKPIKSLGCKKKAYKRRASRSKKCTAVVDCAISRRDGEEMPSTSKTSTIHTDGSENSHEDTESSSYILENITSITFHQPCDADAIKIDNIFSDFFLNTKRLDKSSRMRSRLWQPKETESKTNVPSTSNKPTNEKRSTRNNDDEEKKGGPSKRVRLVN